MGDVKFSAKIEMQDLKCKEVLGGVTDEPKNRHSPNGAAFPKGSLHDAAKCFCSESIPSQCM